MKKFGKCVLVLALVFILSFSGKMISHAAVCSSSPDGVHHFHHVQQPSGYTVYVGTHEYLFGYDENDNPIYHNDCQLMNVYTYCRMICDYCGKTDGNPDHDHRTGTLHSVPHN